MSDFSQSESLDTYSNRAKCNGNDSSVSCISGSKYFTSSHFHYICPIIHFKCDYICHNLTGFTAWKEKRIPNTNGLYLEWSTVHPHDPRGPQGTVLGPSFFLCKMVSIARSGCSQRILWYQVYRKISNFEDLLALQRNLGALEVSEVLEKWNSTHVNAPYRWLSAGLQ